MRTRIYQTGTLRPLTRAAYAPGKTRRLGNFREPGLAQFEGHHDRPLPYSRAEATGSIRFEDVRDGTTPSR